MIGGLARVDVVDSPGATLYLSVFASDEIVCHLGKTETAEERCAGACCCCCAVATAGLEVLLAAACWAHTHACGPRGVLAPAFLLTLCRRRARRRRYAMHAGGKLCPPLGGEQRMAAFPPLRPTEVTAEGDSWKASSKDVAIAGVCASGGSPGLGCTGADCSGGHCMP